MITCDISRLATTNVANLFARNWCIMRRVNSGLRGSRTPSEHLSCCRVVNVYFAVLCHIPCSRHSAPKILTMQKTPMIDKDVPITLCIESFLSYTYVYKNNYLDEIETIIFVG